MNVGAMIAFLKLVQDSGVITGKKATFFDIPPETKQISDLRPVGVAPPTCGPKENLTWIPGSQKYVCLPSLK